MLFFEIHWNEFVLPTPTHQFLKMSSACKTTDWNSLCRGMGVRGRLTWEGHRFEGRRKTLDREAEIASPSVAPGLVPRLESSTSFSL